MQQNLTIKVASPTAKYQVVKFKGEFDKAGHSGIKEEVDKIVKELKVGMLVFDFSELKFINSEGIGYLMEIHTYLSKNDKKLVIVGITSNVEDVFKAIGIQSIMPVYKSLSSVKGK